MKKKIYLITPLLFISLVCSCNGKSTKSNWWDNTSNLTENDIGKIETIIVNNQKHRVRLIGVDHDFLADGSGKAHTTWEFADLLSDANGHSLTTVWNWENGGSSNNLNFINSNVRKALDGKGDAKLWWYEKGSRFVSTTYTVPVIDMLPKQLASKLKEVIKPTVTGLVKKDEGYDFCVSSYNAQVFVLSCQEYTRHIEDTMPSSEGTIYKYYKDNDSIEGHGKKQVAALDFYNEGVDILDGNYHAGNSSGINFEGEVFESVWTRSPSSYFIDYSLVYHCGGVVEDDEGDGVVYSTTRSLAPAFCI